MNSVQIAAALRILANAFEASEGDAPAQPAAEPQKRGRGRPVKGEETPTSTSAATAEPSKQVDVPASQATAVAADPFDTQPAKQEPLKTATLDEVRAALKALAAATSQATALGVLKDHGSASNLTELAPGKFYAVVVAAAAALPPTKTEPVAEADPFEVPGAVAPAVTFTIEDVKAAVIAAQKHTSQDTVQKVVMQYGGEAALPTGGKGPSLKALPPEKFAATIAALKALPATK